MKNDLSRDFLRMLVAVVLLLTGSGCALRWSGAEGCGSDAAQRECCMLNAAVRAINAQRYAEAQAMVDRLTALQHPDSYRFHHVSGELAYKTDDLHGAKYHFVLAVAREEHGNDYHYLARIAERLHEPADRYWQKAAAAYATDVQSPDTDAQAWYDYGTALSSIGADPRALRAYERALELDPDYEKARKKVDALREKSG